MSMTFKHQFDQDDSYLSEILKEKETDVFSGRIRCLVPLENMFLSTCLCSQIHNVIKITLVGEVLLTLTALVGSHVTQTQISGNKMIMWQIVASVHLRSVRAKRQIKQQRRVCVWGRPVNRDDNAEN